MKLVFIILVVNELTFFKLIFNIHKEYEVLPKDHFTLGRIMKRIC